MQFDLRAGEVHVLAGENGAGKSTLIKILAGVHTEYEGTVKAGEDLREVRFGSVQDAGRMGISIIHQELSLVGSMSVADNIFLAREKSRLGWLDRAGSVNAAKKLVSDFGLDIEVTMPAGDYPIGVQQMIEICKALAVNSRIIVMDEPTSALTDVEVEKLFGIIEKLKAQGCGIIYISHKMEEIYRIADRITVLRDGEYIGTDSAEVLNQDGLVKWMVGRELNTQFSRGDAEKGEVRLKVENFTVPDMTGKPAPVVNNVSFEVRGGEILGIAGLQGSGSSELLNGIFGSYSRGVSGSVKVDGEPLGSFLPENSIKKGLALLTSDRKDTGLVLGMDIVKNTTLAALPGFSPNCILNPAAELAAAEKQRGELNLKAATLTQPVETLSGGNQQKVVLAKWILTEPKVLLLDEPTRGVDVGAKHEIYELMNKWTRAGIAIVLITSEMPELLGMSDRIIVMHRGEVTADFAGSEATQERILSAAMGERTENL